MGNHRWCWAVLALAVLLRLLCWWGNAALPERFLEPDSSDYLRLAQGVVTHGEYGSAAQPEIFRVPGYPVLVAGVLATGGGAATVCLLQILIDLGTCWLVWRLARRLFDDRAAIAALFWVATADVLIVASCRVLSESLFVLLFCGCLTLLAEVWPWQARRPDWSAVMTGACLAAACYVRAVMLPVIPVVMVWLLLTKRRADATTAQSRCWWTVRVFPGLVLVAAVGLLLPWIVRNKQVGYDGFSSVGAVNLYRYNAASVSARLKGSTLVSEMAAVDAEFAARPTQAAVAAHAAAAGRRVAVAHPVAFVLMHLRSVPRTLLPDLGWLRSAGVDIGGTGTLAIIQDQGMVAGIRHYFAGKWWAAAMALPAVLVLGLGYVCSGLGMVWRSWQRRLDAFDVLLLLLLAYLLLVPGGAAHPRFRAPAVPILALYAGYGLVGCSIAWNALCPRKRPVAATS